MESIVEEEGRSMGAKIKINNNEKDKKKGKCASLYIRNFGTGLRAIHNW